MSWVSREVMESKISVEPKINSVQNYLSFPGMVFDSGSRSITLMASNRVLADRDVTPRLVLYFRKFVPKDTTTQRFYNLTRTFWSSPCALKPISGSSCHIPSNYNVTLRWKMKTCYTRSLCNNCVLWWHESGCVWKEICITQKRSHTQYNNRSFILFHFEPKS